MNCDAPAPTENMRLLVFNSAAIVLLLATMFLLWLVMTRQHADEEWVRHTDSVLLHLDALLADIVDSETAERGFVISGEPAFLQPYHEARRHFDRDIEALRALTRDNPEQQLRLASAEKVARAELAAFERVIALRSIDPEAATAAVAGGGDKLMTDEVRLQLGSMKRAELQLLRGREVRAAWANRRTVLSVVGAYGALLLALMWTAWTAQRSLVRRQLAERDAERFAATAELEHERRARDDFREQFLGVVGHDLRSPLSAISIETQLLARSTNEAAVRDGCTRILGSTERMTGMVAQLMDVTRSRLGGGMPIVKQRANLSALTARVVYEAARAEPERIETHVTPNIEADFDAARIAQVISNVVGNALQHGVGPVQVTLHAGAHEAVLTVHNAGPPIPEQGREQLFQPFRRGGSQTAGLGLGLFISHEIVVGHNGRIEVQSTAASGTTFTVSLPSA